MRPILPLAACLFASACVSQAKTPAADDPQAKPAAAERRVSLVFTGDLWGQLEPCGCSADMRGGLDRAASYVAKVRAGGPTLLVDAGDALFDALDYPPDVRRQMVRRAQAVAESLVAMGISAKATFERDRVEPGLADTRFPEGVLLDGPAIRTAGGVRVGLVPFDATSPSAAQIPQMKKAGPAKAQATTPGAGSEAETVASRPDAKTKAVKAGGKAGAAADATVGSAEEATVAALRRAVAQARDAGAEVVVLLLHAPRAQAIRIGPRSGADLVVGSHIDTLDEGEESRAVLGETPVFFTQARGQSLLQVDVVLRPGSRTLQVAGNEAKRRASIESIDERIRSYEQRIEALGDEKAAPFRKKVGELQARRRALSEEGIPPPATGSYLAYRFVPITADRPADPKVRKVLDAYDEEVAAANLAFAKKQDKVCEKAAPGEAAFVGGATCAACHSAAKAFWESTKHAEAYATLEHAHKQYDLSCVSCHVTGWERPGGACRVDQVEARKNVTCESCHGPGSLHVANPTKVRLQRQVAEPTCRTCHTPDHSTSFDYATYLKRILGPGHGAPLPAAAAR